MENALKISLRQLLFQYFTLGSPYDLQMYIINIVLQNIFQTKNDLAFYCKSQLKSQQKNPVFDEYFLWASTDAIDHSLILIPSKVW